MLRRNKAIATELHIEGCEQCADCGWTFEFSGLTPSEVDRAMDKHVCETEGRA
jgi:hypothetical protein